MAIENEKTIGIVIEKMREKYNEFTSGDLSTSFDFLTEPENKNILSGVVRGFNIRYGLNATEADYLESIKLLIEEKSHTIGNVDSKRSKM